MKEKLVSYDIWDTVLRRHCHPDTVKLNTANELLNTLNISVLTHLRDPFALLRMRQAVEKEIGAERLKLGWDDEYRLDEVLERWLLRVCSHRPIDVHLAVASLASAELLFERSVIFLDGSIIEKIQSDQATKRIYISDFYIQQKQLSALLESVGILGYFHTGYVSCDVLLNKRSGRLFDYVASIEGSCVNWLHFGDNLFSDVLVPRNKGIGGELYQPEPQHRLRENICSMFSNRSQHFRTILFKDINPVQNSTSIALPLLLGFTLFIHEQVRIRGLKKLYFFTREGEFLLQLYEQARMLSPYRAELPQAEILEVSRLSTFAPSIREMSLQEMMRVWNLYSTQSISALFKTLGLEQASVGCIAESHGLNLTAPIKHPWLCEKVVNLFKDETFLEIATATITKSRALLISYLQGKLGDLSNEHDIGVVDIGWRGSIQDNIAILCPNIRFHGIYLGLNKYLNFQPNNSKKISYGPNLNENSDSANLLNVVGPLEMLCNSPNGSVTSYQKSGSSTRAIRDLNSLENQTFDDYTGSAQSQIISQLACSLPEIFRHAFTSSQIRDDAMHFWNQLVSSPPDDLVRAYFGLHHNETFGLGTYVNKAQNLGNFQFFRMAFSRSGRTQLRRLMSEVGWVDGFLRWRKSSLITMAVRTLRLKH
jgi:FMN phosphatase YigB (HAD superfamily)